MTEKLHISWEEFHRDTRELCAKIKNSGNYDCLARNFFLFRSSHLLVILIIDHHLSNTINLIQIRLNRGIHIHILHIIGLHKK